MHSRILKIVDFLGIGHYQLLALLVIFPYLLLSGCMQHYAEPLTAVDITILNASNAEPSYKLAPGDRLAITFYYNAGLNREVVIRPDGKINLPLIGTVEAADISLEELDSGLTQKYAEALKTSPTGYVLAVGDKIGIRSYYNDKLNDEVTVRPDGKISLILIGEVQAAGISPSELERELQKKYGELLESADLSVIVREFNQPDLTVALLTSASQRVYIGGEVGKPGIIPLQDNLQVLDAVIAAGGIAGGGNTHSVILVRRGKQDTPDIFNIDLNAVLAGETPDVTLRPYDIVYIPRTALGDAASFVRNNFYSLIPNQVLFSFPYNLNKEIQVQTK